STQPDQVLDQEQAKELFQRDLEGAGDYYNHHLFVSMEKIYDYLSQEQFRDILATDSGLLEVALELTAANLHDVESVTYSFTKKKLKLRKKCTKILWEIKKQTVLEEDDGYLVKNKVNFRNCLYAGSIEKIYKYICNPNTLQELSWN